jgi:tripartite-type tricarboxylate transporter receptor subunit TctC
MKKDLFFRSLAGVAVGLCAAAGAPAHTSTQDFPNKPIRLIVPYAPGGSTDVVGRFVAQHLSERWKVQVVVENRPGGNSIIGTNVVAKSPPDSYTLLMATSANATNPSMYTQLPYNAIADFSTISLVSTSPNMIVANPSLPVKDLKELAVLAKAKPGAISYGSAGYGSSQHLTMELIALNLGAKFNLVGYKGAGPATIDAVAGHIALAVSTIATFEAHVKTGRLKALAVTSLKRSAAFPAVPTAAEQGLKNFETLYWLGIMGPRGIPEPIVSKLSAEVGAILKLPDMQARLAPLGIDPVGGSPQEFEAFYRAELASWAKVVKDAKLDRLEQ